MSNDIFNLLRDLTVIAYLLFLRIIVPLLCILFVGKWIQIKMAETDKREQLAHQGEPYCWDTRQTAQTRRAQAAAAEHPDLPCWLAVQREGGGVTEDCHHCPRYAVRNNNDLKHAWEAD
jgi:hypothetical protein